MIAPLADRLRPSSLNGFVGQEHIVGKDKPLKKIIESGNIPNMIFYGPPGVGKTTLATIISKQSNMKLYKLNGTTTSIADIKDIIEQIDTLSTLNGILLYLDEIQYLNKKQQQTLLEFIENGKITLIASTTENPYFYVYNAILSRSTVFEFKSVNKLDIEKAIFNAVEFLSKEQKINIEVQSDVSSLIALSCAGDVRKAINYVELCVLSTPIVNGCKTVSLDCAKDLTQTSSFHYDKNGDEHYDILSAFQKSMRGSDPNAAIHYLARLIVANDLPSICRRLMVCACEDVGLAYPQIIPIVKACVDSAFQLGFPEARIPLADAVIMVCNAPKSNSAYIAIDSAISDINKGNIGDIPRSLKNTHCDGEDNPNKGQFYLYPHDFENHFVKQQYLPDQLKDKQYYVPAQNKNELAYYDYWNKVRKDKLK